MQRSGRFLRLLPVVLLLSSAPAAAVEIAVHDEGKVNLNLLLQPQAQLTSNAAPSGGMKTDLFVRRVRLLFYGDVTKRISFFVETDAPNMGKDGNLDVDVFMQDAFLSFEYADDNWIDVGLILLPLSHNTITGSIALHTLDYHAPLVLFPRGSTKIWRDTGVQFRGFLADKRIHYRAGVYKGVVGVNGQTDASGNPLPALNPHSIPRLQGHVRYNLFGVEDAFFIRGIYFTDKPIVSFGLGADYQPNAVRVGTELAHYVALSLDAFVDVPTGPDQELVFHANALRYWEGSGTAQSGTGFFTELGYRIRKIEPVVSLEWFDSAQANTGFRGYHVGLNYWINKHTVNIKGDLAFLRNGDLTSVPQLTQGTIQAHLFF